MKIQILMEFENELGLEYIKSLLSSNIDIDAILVVGDVPNKFRKELVESRTGGLYKCKGFLYALDDKVVPIMLFKNVNDVLLEEYMKKTRADLVVSSMTKIIKLPLFDLPTVGIINCHAGIISKYRGCSCLEWAVYNNDSVGVTVYFMEQEVDSGPVIFTKNFQFLPGDTYYKVRYRMTFCMADAITEAVKMILKGFTKKDGVVLSKGKFYKPMNDEKLEVVKQKIERGYNNG